MKPDQEEKIANFLSNMDKLGIPVEQLSIGHFRIKALGAIFDTWPTTGRVRRNHTTCSYTTDDLTKKLIEVNSCSAKHEIDAYLREVAGQWSFITETGTLAEPYCDTKVEAAYQLGYYTARLG